MYAHSLTHSLTHSSTHSLTHSLTHMLVSKANEHGSIAVVINANDMKMIQNVGKFSLPSFVNSLHTAKNGNFLGADIGTDSPRGIHLFEFSKEKNTKSSKVVYPHPLTHSLTHSLTRSLAHSLTHSLARWCILSRPSIALMLMGHVTERTQNCMRKYPHPRKAFTSKATIMRLRDH